MEEDGEAEKAQVNGTAISDGPGGLGISYSLPNGKIDSDRGPANPGLQHDESKNPSIAQSSSIPNSPPLNRPSSQETNPPFRHPLAPLSSVNQEFKVPYSPTKKAGSTPVGHVTSLPLKTPQPVQEQNRQRFRRWSSTTNANLHRRNSFPYSRKDTLEDIRALRAEGKKQLFSNGPSAQGFISRPRKGSGAASAAATGFETNGYFSIKPNFPSVETRSRATTTQGVLATPFSTRKESFHTPGTPSLKPRLEALRRESMRSNVENIPTTLWDYLMLELEDFDVHGVEEYKKERLTNFLRIPETFEKVLMSLMVLIAADMVWMDGLSGFLSAYVYYSSPACSSGGSKASAKWLEGD